ncbi:MAG: NADH-quinone oxidoreductase subunit NuoH [Anaerolineales bacterium]|nr:NADH-quinone oxidoreductase subunit NuoH [Anaerolineales bacterium]MCS7246760.1 NADH-quinone oxidoreductase subunit NuoH [Anaerolineales bacterium]MDW8160570.1 NADH-quinone oxidoreductase subunit NuoH [Anaerolineales bacterium]MDW8447107.1 NADH-quinone oxidoreductase subunit NuoH [Anaerolineales bacterium]
MSDPVTFVAKWLEAYLSGLGLASGWIAVIMAALGVIALGSAVLLLDILLVWVERKVVARFQDRLGPNRLGPFGLFQPIADVLKLLLKEDIIPQGADKFVYNLAPILALATVIMLWAVIPISATVAGSEINVGALYIVAVGALGTLSIIMAGWASNNKYALLGAFRMVAQMISYEVPMVIAILIPVILAKSMALTDIVESQTVWYIVLAPIAAIVFLIGAQAELGRAPFDLSEAESEIVAGYHIEYSGMKFGLFYAGELLHALTFGGLFATFFLGGWRGWGAETYPILGIGYFLIKSMFMYWVIMWIKYSFPRVRIDQMLNFCWKFLTPLILTVLSITAILDKLMSGLPYWAYVLGMLLSNLVILYFVYQAVGRYARRERQRVADPEKFRVNFPVKSTASPSHLP